MGKKLITFTSGKFSPTPGELDEGHEDYINPGVFAQELSEFLASALEGKGVKVAGNFAEDWGRMVEIAHDGNFALTVCCANTDDNGHLVHIDPQGPFVRKMFKRIPVQDTIDQLFNTVVGILEDTDGISDLTVENE